MIRTALCTAVLSVSGLIGMNAGAVVFGGEGACPATGAVAQSETCTRTVEAVAAKGESCSKPVEAVAVNAANSDCAAACEGEAKAVAVAAEGETCAAACDAPVQAVAVNAASSDCAAACEGEVEAVAVGNPEAEAMPAGLFTPVNENCPGSGMPVSDGVTTVVSGFTVGFCCGDCKEAFDGKPAAEQTAYVAKHVETTINSECPGSGMPVAEGKTALYNGFAVGFCCDDCKAGWNDADDAKKVAFIAKNHAPENEACPGSGNPINAEVVALYRGHTVGFCCEGCQGKFNKMNDDEKTAIVAGCAMGAPPAEGCDDCAEGECSGDCSADA